MTDHYNELGVGKLATSAEIKKAYKRLASKYHPDKNSTPGAEEKFKRIKEAYETLSNDEKRKTYDNPGWSSHPFESFDSRDVFTQFRNSARQQQNRKPTYTVKISLNQAYNGTVVQITDQSVRVPRGVRTGNKLFMDKFIVEIHIVPHHKFKRSQDDLLLDVSISAFEAMLGIDVILEHIDGNKLKFKINEGIQPGQVMKLRGKGMPNPETDRYGDLLVRVNITIPRLTDDEKSSIMHIQNRKSIEQ